MIKVGRSQRELSQAQLAQRLNVSRYSVIALEKGNPKVAIGVAFEAAAIVGVPLFTENLEDLQRMHSALAGFSALLPKRVRVKQEPIDDNF